MRRRDKRVCRDVVVRMAEEVRREEDEGREEDQEDPEAERILDRIVRMERDLILRALHVDAERVVRPEAVQGDDV